MSRIFITGAADGLGQMAAKLLIAGGHRVVLHARNDQRAEEALSAAPGAETPFRLTYPASKKPLNWRKE